MRTPENTSRRDPIVHLMGSLVEGSSDYITGMEAAGQQQMVAGTTLPTESNSTADEEYLALGFTFGPVVEGDPLFREATLPDGWKREGSDHDMWSFIVDERGIRRVSIFYKAAFYDRRAHMGLLNVGYDVATHWIYGDDDAPELNPALTPDELAEARRSAEQFAKDADQYPSHEGRLPRAKALIAAIDS